MEDKRIDNNVEYLEVHAYDWTYKDTYGDDDHVAIHCWALDKESKPYLVRFNTFPVFCHVQLPTFVRNKIYNWRKESVDNFINLLSQRLGEDAPERYIFKQSRTLYYYRGNRKFPMIQLCFNNLKAMQHCANLLQNPIKTDDWGFIQCKVWENNISIVRKLLTVRNVKYSQWFRVVGYKVEEELRISTLQNEYIAEWTTMTAIPTEECKGWNTYPGVLAFDIECYSHNHRAMPNKNNSRDVAYMISCIYQKYKDPTTRKRYGVIIGECNHIPEEKFSNCKIINTSSEYEMVEAFASIINETDPEILTGYNILSFDYPYLDHRVKRRLNQWPHMGRIHGDIPIMSSTTWKSGAYGHQSINILQMEGRISIDLLPIVKRDYKLEKYDLNTVCKKFIGKTKHDVKAQEMFLIYEDMRNTLNTLIPILREAQNDPSLINDPDYIKRYNDAQKAFDDAKAETTRVMEYCIQDSELVIELMEKINVWVGLVEMSNIVGTTIVELFTRGQQVRCLSQLYHLAANTGFVLDRRDLPGFTFAGGFVYEPIPGLYENIICLDFSSLYPSIIMAYNICYTTLIPPELEDTVPDSDCNIIEFDQDEIDGEDDSEDEDEFLQEIKKKKKKKVKTVKRHYRFKYIKHEVQEGLLPRLVKQLVAERRAVNRQIAQIKEELKALKRKEDVRSAIENYLNKSLIIFDIETAERRVKEFSESDPPAPPEVITAAKRDLMVAQLFNIECASVTLNTALESKPPKHPNIIDEYRFELIISTLYQKGDTQALCDILTKLNESRKERISAIESLELLMLVLDKRQWALKISANSFFGFLGVQNGGKMPLIEGAMSITAKGRELIKEVRKFIEEKYQGVQVYGDTDSLPGHTPVLIRTETGSIDFIQIRDLMKLSTKMSEDSTPRTGTIVIPQLGTFEIPDFKPKDEKDSKQYYDFKNYPLEVWTDEGWSKIKYLMKHKTHKQLYRVLTDSAVVDVTEDHSLLDHNANEVTPNDVSVGTKLLHKDLPNIQYDNCNINDDEAWLWGFFMADGTCSTHSTSSWSISNHNNNLLNKAQKIMLKLEPNYDFIIDSTILNVGSNSRSVKLLATKYNDLFYTNTIDTTHSIRFKKVPYQILIAPKNIKLSFLRGWCDAIGNPSLSAMDDFNNLINFDIKGQIGAAGLYYLCASVGYKASVSTLTDKDDFYRISIINDIQLRYFDKIKKIIPLGSSLEDVFDIETENHHFGAGIGRMIVHNSVMVHLPQIKDPKECDYWGNRLAQDISGIKPGEKDCDGVIWPEGRPGLFPPPLAMEFEKAMRLLCLKKKKYAAYLIDKNGRFKTEDITDKAGNVIGSRLLMLLKGIILARRDNCFTGDTLVTLSNGTSVQIKDLIKENAKVYGWNGTGLTTANQTAFMYQGKKKCIKIMAMDGRTITCTPEHRVLVKEKNGNTVWKEAQNLNLSTDKLVCGLEAPEDIIGDDENEWHLNINGNIFDLKPENRVRTLAFMRILGFINADGSISVRHDGRIDCTVPLGHMVDANNLLDDIELICGLRPIITQRTTKLSSFYRIRIPRVISEIFTNIPGQDVCRRSEQPSSWPDFILDTKCPRSVLREFCGGLFGGDGISPYLTGQNVKNNSHKIDQSIIIGLSTRCEYKDSLQNKMELLCDILARAGYSGCRLSSNVEIYSVKKGSKDPNDQRVMFRILSSGDKCDFLRKIGYRYCIHKHVRQTAAQSYWRFEETIKRDRRDTLILGKQIKDTEKITYQQALDKAKEIILRERNILYPNAIHSIGYNMFYEFCRTGPVTDNTLRRFCEIPATIDWLTDIGALSWFDKDGYSVNRSVDEIPVLYLPIYSIIDDGEHDVYDISVDQLESFIANGIVVHNCKFLRETYTKILDMILDRRPITDTIDVLVDSINDLLNGRVPYDDLVIIRELGANYKSDSFFMKVFSDNLKRAGKLVNPGDRLDFLIVDDPKATLLGQKMRLTEQYLDSLDTDNPEQIDYNYYIEKVLMNPINQLFEVGFSDIIGQLSHIRFKPKHARKFIYLNHPVKMMLKMLKQDQDINELKNRVRAAVTDLKSKLTIPSPPLIKLNIIPRNTTILPTPQVNISTTDTHTNAPEKFIPPLSSSTSSSSISYSNLPTIPISSSSNLPIVPTNKQFTLNILPSNKIPTTPSLVFPKIASTKSYSPPKEIPPTTKPTVTLNITANRVPTHPVI